MKLAGNVGNGPMNKRLDFGGDPDHRLDTGIVFRICHYWEIRKVASTDCAARRWSAGHAPAGIAIARHRPTTDSHDRRALAVVGMHCPSASSLICCGFVVQQAVGLCGMLRNTRAPERLNQSGL